MKREVLIGIVKDWGLALIIVLGVLTVWNWVAGPMGVEVPAGDPAPDFTLADTNGESYTLSASRGEVVVLNFWATWCGPCRREIPAFARFHEQNPDVEIWGVSVDDRMDPAKLAREAKRLGINYTVLHDATSQVANTYGVQGLPTTFVVRADGSIGGVHVGPLDEAELAEMIAGTHAH